MTVLVTAIAFLVLLSLLVMIHEWGHYMVAKKSGVVVEEFGFGIPPRAKTLFVHDGTKFSLNWIPFGGFVRLQGENVIDERQRHKKGNFSAAPILSRCAILVAGVCMNFLLALVIFIGGFWLAGWSPTYLSFDDIEAAEERGDIAVEWGVYIQDVQPDTPAALADIQPDGILSAVNGVPLTQAEDILALQGQSDAVTYTILTGDDYTEETTVTLDLVDGRAGLALQNVARQITLHDSGFLNAVQLSFRETGMVTAQTVKGIGHLFSSLAKQGQVPDDISGIVGIAQITHDSIQDGWMAYLRLIALLSLSLAVLNILPFPALDGGRLLFVLIEACTCRPLHRRVEHAVNAIGFIFLLGLIVLITVNDVLQLFQL